MSAGLAPKSNNIKVVLFDFMGTCLDWHNTVIAALPNSIPAALKSPFALEWRQAYFDSNSARLQAGLPPEDFDDTLRTVLVDVVLNDPKHASIKQHFTDDVTTQLITAWHRQTAWPEVKPAIQKLRDDGYEVYVHANGSTRLQLDLCRSAGLQFDTLFSSELLGVYKPAPENYRAMLRLIRRRAGECVTVAAHVYDLRGAKAVGMKTVYVRRWTDDVLEDQDEIRREVDVYLEDMNGLDWAVAGL